MNTKNEAKMLARSSMIAALYVVLTLFANALGLASGAIQVRLSEALTVLPIFFPEAIWGLGIGCLISNIITGCALPDIVFGTLATLIGAFGTYALKKNRLLAIMCPVISNSVIVPFVLKIAYGLGDAWYYLAFSVCIGELVSCVVLGKVVIKITDKYYNILK